MLDLLIKLDSESDDTNKLKILLPLDIISFGTNRQNCSFVYLLHKNDIISKESVLECLIYKIFDLQMQMDNFDNNDNNENSNPNICTGAIQM
ncbi:hypothetical protein M9Y10_002233 [Tritrichomonas musculus]|uniref:Uncharacterized protein n=1 Tax=Tritrichomonas musculus TaxID=1915356 RepID=A0ABR2L976_9EUKA